MQSGPNDHMPAIMAALRARVARADADYERWERSEKRGKTTASAAFLRSPEWAAARAECLRTMGSACSICGRTDRINVDHIMPRCKFPGLALDPGNLRPLCWPCNRRKAARIPTGSVKAP